MTQAGAWTPEQAIQAGGTATATQTQQFFSQVGSGLPGSGVTFDPSSLLPSGNTWLIVGAIALGAIFVVGKVLR
jgi:hypothetical protein